MIMNHSFLQKMNYPVYKYIITMNSDNDSSSSALVVQNDRYIAFCEMFRAMFSDIDMALLIINACDTGPRNFRSICTMIALTCGAAHMDAILRIYLSLTHDKLVHNRIIGKSAMDQYPIYKPNGLFALHSFASNGSDEIGRFTPVSSSICVIPNKFFDVVDSIRNRFKINNTVYVNMQTLIDDVQSLKSDTKYYPIYGGDMIYWTKSMKCYISNYIVFGSLFAQFNGLLKKIVISKVNYFIISSAISPPLRREYIARLNDEIRMRNMMIANIEEEDNMLHIYENDSRRRWRYQPFSRKILYLDERTQILQLDTSIINIAAYELPVFYINNATFVEEIQMRIT